MTTRFYQTTSIRYINDWEELLEVSKQENLLESVYLLEDKNAAINNMTKEFTALDYTQNSPITYKIQTSTPGYIVYTAPYDPHWKLDDKEPLPNLGLTNLYPLQTAEDEATLYYSQFNTLLIYYVISSITLVALILLALKHVHKPSTGNSEKS
ncbi:MAG: hypothetical protein ABIH76_08280 [Candidatus Bathyarchaeota archaeon]